MPKVAFHTDLKKTPESAEVKTHNRWHPDIPFVETYKPGAEFRVECFDWTGGQIAPDDSANDVRDVDLTKVHYLSGPFGVDGAEPGDLMVVDLLDIGYLPDSPWGFTGIFAKENGGGFLVDHYPQARKAVWDFHGIYTASRHIPGVRWAGIIHPGLIGCLPDRELLERANRREAELLHQSRPRAAVARTTACTDSVDGTDDGPNRANRCGRGVAHRAPARAWWQLRHQEPVARLENILPRLCQRRRAIDG